MTIVPPRLLTHLVLCCLALAPQPGQGRTAPNPGASVITGPHVTAPPDGQHDFDFEFGEWKATLSRLQQPLSGSVNWVDYEGTSIVRKVWDGRANLGELKVDGKAGHIAGLTLRLYDPRSHQWRISWANATDGIIGAPMIGEFRDGRGEFYNQESFNGRAIFVRFIFSEITPTRFRFEQAFSSDGGKSWEVNWKATFTR